MKEPIIYALDFDGVICDSAIETGVSAWKSAATLWDDISSPLPDPELLEKFRQVRPIMGTGYESILIIRLLYDGETVEVIMADYRTKTQKVIEDFCLNIDSLKRLFGETRDSWIEDDLDGWIDMNPLFSGVAEKLQQLSRQAVWYIVTTKQERFVKHILSANQIKLAEDRIFGLDRKMTKEEILIDLAKKHAQERIYFVEDMLASLLKVLNNDKLESVKLFLALWGYNTAQDKLDAETQAIELIDIDGFILFQSL